MASNRMLESVTDFLDEDSDSEKFETYEQFDDGSATESASDTTPNFPQSTSINSNENKRKIVIRNLPEPFGSDLMKDQSDRHTVLQILYSIKAGGLENSIASIQREGNFDPNDHSRPVIVTFNTEDAQRVAVQSGSQLATIQHFNYLKLHAYNKMTEESLAQQQQQMRRQSGLNNQSSRNQSVQSHATPKHTKATLDGPPQPPQMVQIDKRRPRPALPVSPQLSQHSSGSNGNYHDSLYNLSNDMPRSDFHFQNQSMNFNAHPQNGKQLYSGMPNQLNMSTTNQTEFPQMNAAFGSGQHGSHAENSYQNGIPIQQRPQYQYQQMFTSTLDPNAYSQNANHQYNGRPSQPNMMMPNQQGVPFQQINSSFGSCHGIPLGTQQPNPMMFNPNDPMMAQMMAQFYAMFLNSQQFNPQNAQPPNINNNKDDNSESTVDEEEDENDESTTESEEEVLEKPNCTNDLFKAQAERVSGTKKELNILVLGETGVGKSTWINGIANYMSFDTLEDALNAQRPICLIASKFSFYETNEDKIDVKLEPSHGDKDENESFSDHGQSSTQEPKTYQFETAKYIVNIIDTPGIGDTRGVDQDKENARKILGAIAHYKHLHAICFLFKANEARMTLSFRYCISEILLQLHKDAVENIIFFFTNSRGTFYKPGDTMGPLTAFLSELHDQRGLQIVLNSDKICCTDNEAFRLVCAHFNGAKFTEEDFQNFAGSWKQSAAETHRFIESTARQRPHHVADTVSINKARTIIYHLAKPLADVNELIESNIKVFDNRKKELQSTAADLDELKKKLKIPQIGIEVKQLDYPKTVCAATGCIDTMKLPHTEQYQTIYKQICHDHCYLTGVDVERVPEPHLLGCAAMAGQQNCKVCRCLWSTHMHIRFDQIKTSVEVEDNNTKTLIQQKQDATKIKEKMIKDCENIIDELKKEQQKIIKTSLRFGSFLQKNAILPYNDAFEKYVEQTISEEEKCIEVGGDRSKLTNLRNLLNQYRQEKSMLIEAMKSPVANGGNTITPDEIEVMKVELFGLKHTGKTLKKLFDATESGLAKHQAHVTVKYVPPKPLQQANFGKYKKQATKEKPSTSNVGTKKQQKQQQAKDKKKDKNKRK